MPETILDLTTRVHLEPLKAGLNEAVGQVDASVGKINKAFSAASSGAMTFAKGLKEQGVSFEDALAAMQSVGTSAAEATTALEAVGLTGQAAGAEVAEGMQQTKRSVTDARFAAMALGEEIGVTLPRAVTTLLARSQLIGPVLNAAFSAIAAVALIEVFGEVINKIDEVSESLGGMSEEQKRIAEEERRLNSQQIQTALRLAEEKLKLNEIGAEGSKLSAQEVANQKELVRLYNERLAATRQTIAAERKELEDYNSLSSGYPLVPNVLIAPNVREHMKEVTDSLALNLRLAQQFTNELSKLQTVKLPELSKKSASEAAADARALGAARLEVEKSIGLTRVAYEEQIAKELFSADKITLDQEITALESAERHKYEIEQRYLEQRKSLLASEHAATGKDTAPEIAKINGELEALETQHQAKMAAITADGVQRRLRIEQQVGDAKISAAQSVAAAQLSLEEGFARAQFDGSKASAEQQATMLREAQNEFYNVERAGLERRLAIARELPEKNAAEIERLNGEIETAEIEHQARLAEIDHALTNEQERLALQRQNQRETESEKSVQATISTTDRAAGEEIKQAEAAERYGELTFRDKITRIAQIIAAQHQEATAAVQASISEAEADRSAATTEQEREAAIRRIIALKDQLARIDQEYSQRQINLADQVSDREMADAQRTANVISGSLERTFEGLTTSQTKFSTQMAKMWNDMVQGWARIGGQIVAEYIQALARIVIQEALTAVHINTIHTSSITLRKATESVWDQFLTALGIKRTVQTTTEEASQTAAHTAGVVARQSVDAANAGVAAARDSAAAVGRIQIDAGAGGAAAFASVIEALPFPANVATAPGVAAGVVAAIEGFTGLAAAGGAVASAREGFDVPATPGGVLTMLHSREMVLPAHIAEPFRAIAGAYGSLASAPDRIGAPASGASGSSTSNVFGSTTHNIDNRRTYHNYEANVTVNQKGNRMSPEEITEAVRLGIKRRY